MMGKVKIFSFLLLSSLVLVSAVSFERGNGWRKVKILDRKEGICGYVRWSPDGKYILVFRQVKPKLYSVWLVDVWRRKAKELRRYELIRPKHAVWSYDSHYIALTDYNPETQRSNLWLVDVREGTWKFLVEYAFLEEAYHVIPPIWSPRELKLIYTIDEGGYLRERDEKIYLYDIPSGRRKLVYDGGSAQSFSPNGRYVVFVTCSKEGEGEYSEYKWGLAMADLETFQVFPLVDTDVGWVGWSPDSERIWSPDGERIAYQKERTGGIYIMELGSKKEKMVASNGGTPTWSPDGRYIAYIGYGLSKPPAGEELAMDVCVLDLKTGKHKQVTFDGASGDFAFNPKSSNILAYISYTLASPGYKGRLFLYLLKEGKKICLSSKICPVGTPAVEAPFFRFYEWSPDGRYIAYSAGGDLWIAGPFIK